MKQKGRFRVVTGLMVACVILSGCGSSAASYSISKDEAAYDNGGYDYVAENAASVMDYEMDYYEGSVTAAGASGEFPMQEPGTELLEENTQQTGRKLIKTADLFVETEDYDALLGSLEQQIAALGGYIEYQYQYNGSSFSGYQETRNANMEIRIPAGRLDEFVVKVGEWSNITNKEERVEDVTLRYVDLESHKKALLTEQDRLLALLEMAESIEDVIAIEQRLSEVRYELESMESQLRALTNLIDYSTINLYIQEVKRLTPVEEKSAWDKMKNGFIETIYRIGDNIEYGFIRFVINLPYFIIWIIIIVIVLFVIRAFVKRRKHRKEAEKQKTEAKEQRDVLEMKEEQKEQE